MQTTGKLTTFCVQVLILVLNSSLTIRGAAQDSIVSVTEQQSCLHAARKLLGPKVEILKIGHLSESTHIEAIIAIRVPGLKDDKYGIPISRLLIVQKDKDHWSAVLTVDREITNSAGYVGFDFIDDSNPIQYYRANFSGRGVKWGNRDPKLFTLILTSMDRTGRTDEEDLGTGIGWNTAVGRFQEIDPNGEEFRPEVKNPKHIRSRR